MNCLLLPLDNFSADNTAIIDTVTQIEHVHHVLGAKVGDTLKIGQIGGNLGRAVIADMTNDSIRLADVQLDTPPPAKLGLTVVLALPRPKVLRRLIMDMTALGVDSIVLVNSYRTQKSYWQSPMLERLDEFVLEGLQQGVDTMVPTIRLEKRFKPFVEDSLAELINGAAIVAHPYGAQSFAQFLQAESSSVLPTLVCIGAEGGWIDYEIALFATQGCEAVHIGPRILRTEAAVNAILGQWLLVT